MDIKSRLEKTLLGTDNFLLRLNYNKTVYLLYSVFFFFGFAYKVPSIDEPAWEKEITVTILASCKLMHLKILMKLRFRYINSVCENENDTTMTRIIMSLGKDSTKSHFHIKCYFRLKKINTTIQNVIFSTNKAVQPFWN